MPGWHDATRKLQEEGKIQTVGIIQEQHPERARLFMQWKQMDWPILVDSLDLLDVSVVPITLLIDGEGIVRQRVRGRKDAREVVESFLTELAAEQTSSGTSASKPIPTRAPKAPPVEDARATGDYHMLWGKRPQSLTQAIEAFDAALAGDPLDSSAAFRLGVAYRARYDSSIGEVEDFTRAVQWWTRARELDPNNYIWMRRLQQYGPRLAKPYPFYDWVDQARKEITDRGETPPVMTVFPRGAELTAPLKQFEAADASKEPDTRGRIIRDPGKYVSVQTLTVPLAVEPGGSTRVHLEFRPNTDAEAHWNNEASGMVLWVDAPEGWETDRRLERLELDPNVTTVVSDETRRLEFEVKSSADARSTHLDAYALYYVCEGINGQCLYRRQDIRVPLSVAPSP